MIGRKITMVVAGLGRLSGTLLRETKDCMVIRGEDKTVSTVSKKWISMFQFGQQDARTLIYVYGVKTEDGKDTGVRFFRVGEQLTDDGRSFLSEVSVKGKSFLVGEISELDIDELRRSLDGTITGDNG